MDLLLPPIYRFPYSEYTIIGDKNEIERMCRIDGKKIHIDHNIVENSMSRTSPNYVSKGHSVDSEKRVFEAFQTALTNLPISIDRITDIVIYVWFGENSNFKVSELKEMVDYLSSTLGHINAIFGVGLDKSLGNNIEVSMIATIK